MRTKIAVALATVYLVWGSTYLAMRWMVHDIPALIGGGARYLTAGLVFYAAGRALGGAPPTRRELRGAASVGLVLVGVCNGLVCIAVQRVPSGMTALILAIMPLWMALIELCRPGGARPGPRAALGLCAGFVGTGLLVWRGHGDTGVDPVGAITLAASAFLWAAGSLYARHAARPRNWVVSSGVEMTAGAAGQLLFAAAHGDFAALSVGAIGPRALWSLLYLITIGSMGYGTFSWLIRNARPALVSTYGYVNPLVAVVLGAVLAGEPVGPRTLVAGAVIIGSVVLVSTARR